MVNTDSESSNGDEHASVSGVDDQDDIVPEQDESDVEEPSEIVEKKKKKKKKVHRLELTETENFNEKLRKRGVIYIARIPPRMTPTKVKALLSEFAEVTRVYLVEEDQTIRKRRKKEYGGSGGKRYIEGWVEFASKKKAKHIATSLNSTPISSRKRDHHYGR